MIDNWQPIETAPKNVAVLVYMPLLEQRRRIVVAELSTLYSNRWYLADAGSWAEDATLSGEPTHWRSLPSPPSTP